LFQTQTKIKIKIKMKNKQPEKNKQPNKNKENFDKPPILTNYLYTLYKQLAKKWGLSKSSKN